MPVTRIGITADDITGAADTAAVFARLGMPVPVSLDLRPRGTESRPVFAVTTNSRAAAPEEVHRLVRESAEALLAEGAEVLYKKVDSNLRGNVAAELAAAHAAANRTVLFAPAFPARGRTTRGGVALVHGVPVAETEMANDPEAPVRHSNILDLLAPLRGELRVRHCPLAALRAGADAISSYVEEGDVVVIDAENDEDLDVIAAYALSVDPRPTLAGSAGLAGALARQLFVPRVRPEWPRVGKGPVLAVLASASEELLAQVSAAAEEGHLVPFALPCNQLSSEERPVPELDTAISAATAELAAGRDAVVHAAGPLPPVERPVELVVEHLAHLTFVVVKRGRPRGLLVGGGATAHGVLATLGTEAVEVDDEPLPGIAGGVAVGGHFAGRPVALKPGAAGDEQAIVHLLGYLRQRAAALEEEP
jgi:uncharacterized protein YgbK (DUF1537 family)